VITETPAAFRGIPQTTHPVVRARAPLRISFCGGGTDVPPYPELHGGCVLSSTIDKYTYVSLRPRLDQEIHVRSADENIDVTYHPSAEDRFTGKLDLAQAIFRRFGTTGIDCFMHSDAAPGSGLGSSSSMIVSLSAALACAGGLHYSEYEMASLAYVVERDDLQIIGGLQDQYAATFGGFNFIEFSKDGVIVTPLGLREDLLNELHYHLLLCYTGGTRLSSNILREQTGSVTAGEAVVMDSLAELKEIAVAMKRSLLRGRLLDFGQLLDDAWVLKRRLAKSISTEQIDAMYDAARRAGAVGGKILGAGGGGYLLVFVPVTRRERVSQALSALGGSVVGFQFEKSGIRTWHATSETWPAM
jgi:D-glycero-alpha-D-manno-heptose-7-phosphate kinase